MITYLQSEVRVMESEQNDLFEWYLAFLRKNAQDRAASSHFTPLSLIAADNELLQQIIEDGARKSTNGKIPAPLAQDQSKLTQTADSITAGYIQNRLFY